MKKLVEKFGKKKVYGTASVLGVLIVVIVCSAIYFINQDKDRLMIKADSITVELGKEVSLKPSVFLSDEMEKQDVNATVVKSTLMSDTKKYDFDEKKQTVTSKDRKYLEVGKYEINLTLDDEKAKVTLEVKDTTKPTFKDLKKEIKVEQNAKDVDFTKYFKAEDLSKVTVKVDASKVELSKTGEYTLTVTATDEYKNKTEAKVKVIVVSLEEAEKGNVSEMLDGTKPKSEALAKKQEEQKKEETNNAGNNNVTNNTGNTGNTGNGGNNTGGNTGNTGNTGNNGGTNQQPQQPAKAIYRTDIANTYVAQINAWRQANGVPALRVTAAAQAEANMRAMQLVSNFAHNSSYGFAENIGKGPIGSDFFTLWKNSPNHNQSMLEDKRITGEPIYKGFAVAVVEYNGEWFAITSFELAQLEVLNRITLIKFYLLNIEYVHDNILVEV